MNPTYAVLYGELILSLYPILIKTVNTNIYTQILARFIAFPVLALSFGSLSDFSSIWNTKNAFSGILYNIINLGHIAASYIAFKNLPIGTAISLFYLYPIFNVIAGSFIGEPLSFLSICLIIISFIGTYLIASSYSNEKTGQLYGVIMGIVAALTETIIFISVRSINKSPYYTINNLYPAGLVALVLYAIFNKNIYNKNIIDTNPINWTKLLCQILYIG